jgi:hypothetical protein
MLTGWSETTSRDWKDTPGMATTGTNPDGSTRDRIDMLPRQAYLAGWTTPTAAERERSPEIIEKLAAKRFETCGQTTVPLYHCEQVQLAGWPTPTAGDGTGSRMATGASITGRRPDGSKTTVALNMAARFIDTNSPARLTVSGEMLTGCSAGMESGGQLSPAHSLWLMLGPFAIAWLNCAERVTRSTSRKRRVSSER